jgi:hypothetical protein
MPKKKQAIRLIEVRSKAYGKHLRAARGSHTKATVNKSLQQHASRTALLNKTAKPVHDAITAWAGIFKHGRLWPQLLSKLRSSEQNKLPVLLQQLVDTEINIKYPANRFGNLPAIAAHCSNKKLLINMAVTMAPYIGNAKADCYYYELMVLFMGARMLQPVTVTAETEWIHAADALPQFEMEFDIPARATCYLICLGVRIGEDDVVIETFATEGRQIVLSGEIT